MTSDEEIDGVVASVIDYLKWEYSFSGLEQFNSMMKLIDATADLIITQKVRFDYELIYILYSWNGDL